MGFIINEKCNIVFISDLPHHIYVSVTRYDLDYQFSNVAV